jgi:hypothetical protein
MSNTDDSNRASAVPGWRRRPAAFLLGAVVVAALAIPVLAAEPSAGPSTSPGSSVAASSSPSAQPSETAQPTATVAPTVTPQRSIPSASPQPAQTEEGAGKPDKANKGNKTPEIAITLRGTVSMATDAKGRQTFSMVSGGTTYELGAGPPWFWGTNNPLAKFAGKTATIAGETHVGESEVDVLTVDGVAIRAPGKPPWAGGWKVQGEKHPGWSQAKADRFKAKFGDCWPPGHCKQPDTAPSTGPLGD